MNSQNGMSSTSPNGRGRFVARKVRVDRRLGDASDALGRPVSGRWVIGLGVAALLSIWGGLYFAFNAWRDLAEERIAYGKERVAPVVSGFAEIEPPGVDPEAWRIAVADTRRLVEEFTGTGRLDIAELDALRDDLGQRADAAASQPERAVEELASIWFELALMKPLREETEPPELLRPALEARLRAWRDRTSPPSNEGEPAKTSKTVEAMP